MFRPSGRKRAGRSRIPADLLPLRPSDPAVVSDRRAVQSITDRRDSGIAVDQKRC